ncbi:2-oxo acid dehydrogenase subunit E2 [Thalassotalea psychrophila]|uniref:Dihydrolipoamide acetyltransferase component of pyruvate dehydrogenase complex n=1 Tax=Thalassotalea psychrophila TaxID=3065647 RepID=A0ABY9U4M3_9GAMM|nr:2-oxo acid dehydrogenase subunit E2 [Colwelliaceae bacterium SQ149]
MSNYLIEVPDIGEGIAEVEVVEWNVAIGSTVEEDDVLCVVMTDKATVEIPSPVGGKIEWRAVEAGDMIAVGADFVKLQVAADESNFDESAESEPVAEAELVVEETIEAVTTEVEAAAPTHNLPGNYYIDVPDIGEGIAEVEIVEWNLNIGDSIEEDDVLCVVMTDKATVEIPAPIDGKLLWRASEAGEMIAVGAMFVRLDVGGEGNLSELKEQTSATPATVPAPVNTETLKAADPVKETIAKSAKAAFDKPTVNAKNTSISSVPVAAQSIGAPRAEGDKPMASPAVRQRALNAGINLNFVRGSGPAERITHDDLDAFIAGQSNAMAPMANFNAGPTADESVEEVKVIGLRRKIAAIMQDTMQRIPHFTYVEEIDVTELEKLRAKLNKEKTAEQPKLTMLPFFMKALVIAMKEFPEMSARFDDDDNIVYRYGAAHVGIATQTDSGLVVPVVRHAETLDLWQSADEVKRLSTAARSGKAKREELSGSTITITSLGPMGGIVTTPVINSPEVAIIGINKMAKRPVWQDGGFVPRDIMNISSSFDHRVIDGWEATLFVQRIKSLLESPATLFMKG